MHLGGTRLLLFCYASDMTDALTQLAQETRSAFECGNIDPAMLKRLYAHYNPAVKDTARFIKKASSLFPAANCGIASLYLRYKLGAGKIVQGAYSGEGHTFLLIEGFVVDITADQFGGPAIYVGPLEKPWAVA